MISRKNGFDFRARKTFVEKLLAAAGAPEIQLGTRNCPKIDRSPNVLMCGYKNVKHCKYKSKYQYTPVLLDLYIYTLYHLYNLWFTIVTCFRTKTNSL